MLITSLKIGFIGASKMGTVLARYFQKKELTLSGFYSTNSDALAETCKILNCFQFSTMDELFQQSDIVFITTKDHEIATQCLRINELAGSLVSKKYLYHGSGALSSEIFESLIHKPLGVGSLHPMASFHDKSMELDFMDTTIFALEGEDLSVLEQLLGHTQNKFIIIDKHKKTEYHIACVAMTSFFISLYRFSEQLFNDCLVKNQDPEDFTSKLPKKSDDSLILLQFAETMIKKLKTGISAKEALTGPLIRQDYATLQQHMKQLTNNNKKIYQALSYQLLDEFVLDKNLRTPLLNALEIQE